MPVTLKFIEDDEIRRLITQCRQGQCTSETPHERRRPKWLNLPLGIAMHRQIQHRAHRFAEFSRQCFTEPPLQMGRRRCEFCLCIGDSPIP
jgi:hypothetical protein